MKFENLYRELLSEAAQRAVRYVEEANNRARIPFTQITEAMEMTPEMV